MTCLEFSAVLVNAGTFIALTVLLIWSTVHLFGGDGNEDGGNRWVNEEGQWDFELGPDGSDSIKVLYDLVVLIIASGAMFGPLYKGWDLGNGVYHKVNVGIIAGSTYMFSNMLLVSFWYMFDFDVSSLFLFEGIYFFLDFSKPVLFLNSKEIMQI